MFASYMFKKTYDLSESQKKHWETLQTKRHKIVALLMIPLLIVNFTFAIEDDDILGALAGAVVVVGGVAAGVAIVSTAPLTVTIAGGIAAGATVVAGGLAIGAALNCDCSNCSSPCSCSDLGCTRNNAGDQGCASVPYNGKWYVCDSVGRCGDSNVSSCGKKSCGCS